MKKPVLILCTVEELHSAALKDLPGSWVARKSLAALVYCNISLLLFVEFFWWWVLKNLKSSKHNPIQACLRHRIFTLNGRLWHFLTHCHSVYSQNPIRYFQFVGFWPKILLLRIHLQKNCIPQVTSLPIENKHFYMKNL